MAKKKDKKTRAERLLERQRILAGSPYLREEIGRLREELGIAAEERELDQRLEEARGWGEWSDPNGEEISFAEFTESELERRFDHATGTPEFARALADLAKRYRYGRRAFFEGWLVWGEPPDLGAPSGYDLRFPKDGQILEHGQFVEIETDPPKPDLREGQHYVARLFKWWPFVLKEQQLKSIKLVVEPWTTIEDVEAAWRRVERLQRGLPGYDGQRLKERSDLETDIALHQLVYVESRPVEDAINMLIDRLKADGQQPRFSTDAANVGKSLRKLDEKMKPKP